MSDTVLLQPVRRRGVPGQVWAWRSAWIGMDKNPVALDFARSARGIAVINIVFLAVFAATMPGPGSLVVAAGGLTGCALFPQRRALAIGLSTLFFIFLRPLRSVELKELPQLLVEQAGITGIDSRILVAGAVTLFLGLSFASLRLQSRFRHTRPAQRPVLSLLVVFFAMAGIATSGLLTPAVTACLWIFLAVYASTCWALAYALVDQKLKDTLPAATRMGFFRPFWGGSPVPMGKGAGFLQKFEAKDDTALAVSRLKGLKLMVWGAMLTGVHALVMLVFHDNYGLPTLIEAIEASAAGAPLPLHMEWLALIAHYFLGLIFLAAWSHIVVAMVRMAGYCIPRNTVRPLAARTLAEFWNRYYYYFKELLVDFFFFPTFLRWFKKSPKLRIAFATFCAAAAGNFIFHIVERVDMIATGGFLSTLEFFLSYLLYTLVLATGLIVSQLRNRKPKPEDGFLRYEVLPRLNVGLFFCLLTIFDGHEHLFSIGERLSFLISLFGVTT
jgi:hypothetical protein